MKIDVGKIALVAVMIAGIQVNALYHRIDDLECQRDIYKSRYEDWEGVSKEIAEYADTLRIVNDDANKNAFINYIHAHR